MSKPFFQLQGGIVHEAHSETPIPDYDAFYSFMVAHCEKTGSGSFQISSSLNWPEDETNDPQVIQLCERIRNF